MRSKPIDVLQRGDSWEYVPAAKTDLRRTFKRVREQQKQREQEQLDKVIRMRK